VKPSHVVNGIELFDYDALVRSRAKKRWSPRKAHLLDEDDLYQSGWCGLIRAAEEFDHSRGFKFMTLAYRYVDGFMLRELYGEEWAPEHLFKTGDPEAGSKVRRILPASAVFRSDEAEAVAFERREARPDWRAQLREAYVDVAKALSERERLVVGARVFGEHTLREVGQVLGVTHQRAKQIQQGAALKARAASVRYPKRRQIEAEEPWKPSPAVAGAVPA
jgi:RNA polymerase sigma factor (sigma-70 family)